MRRREKLPRHLACAVGDRELAGRRFAAGALETQTALRGRGCSHRLGPHSPAGHSSARGPAGRPDRTSQHLRARLALSPPLKQSNLRQRHSKPARTHLLRTPRWTVAALASYADRAVLGVALDKPLRNGYRVKTVATQPRFPAQ